MTLNLPCTLVLLLAALVAACSATSPSPTPTTASSAEAPTPFTSPGPVTPGLSASPAPTATFGPIPSLGTTTTAPVVPSATAGASATPSATLPPGPLADALAGQLADILQDQRGSLRIPGMSASIVFPDGSRWDTASGFADLGRERPATTDTTFVTGSITKTFIATAFMQLEEEGVLSIDDPLADWLPDYPRAADITLAHLLAHTSGVYNYFEHPEYNVRIFDEPDHEWTPREILNSFVLEPYFAPGTGYHYSNTNFVLLGMVLQRATDTALPQLLRERFFEPLGLERTFSQAAGPPPDPGALGYLVRQSGPIALDDGTTYRPTKAAGTVAWAAGDIISTASDLADWARTVYGGDLLEPESLAKMTNYNYSSYARGTYALGTRTRLFGEQRMFGHTGSLRGFDAAMWHLPELDLTMVVLTNRGRMDVNPIIDALAEIAMPPAQSYVGR